MQAHVEVGKEGGLAAAERGSGWLQTESTGQGKAGTGLGGKHHGRSNPAAPVLGQTLPSLQLESLQQDV